MAMHDEFLGEIERFLQLAPMAPTKFGTEAVGDPTFVFELRSGRSPNLKTVERVKQFITDYAQQKTPRAAAQ